MKLTMGYLRPRGWLATAAMQCALGWAHGQTVLELDSLEEPPTERLLAQVRSEPLSAKASIASPQWAKAMRRNAWPNWAYGPSPAREAAMPAF